MRGTLPRGGVPPRPSASLEELESDALRVDSFEPADAEAEMGTVQAYAEAGSTSS
ncbi:MAG TPA: hypothetical protein VFR37_24910 [Longimicrobium sp.]|nr:hypothetical protein [Longimicrobium sp.]